MTDLLLPGQSYGIARWTPCSCATAPGMWDRAILFIRDHHVDRARPVADMLIERYEERRRRRGPKRRDVEQVADPAAWREDVLLGVVAEVVFADLTGYRWLEGTSVGLDVAPDWDVKFSRKPRLWVTDERGRDEYRYAAMSGGWSGLWLVGFATGAAVRARGEKDVHFGEPGFRLDYGGLHRFPDDPKLHKPVKEG